MKKQFHYMLSAFIALFLSMSTFAQIPDTLSTAHTNCADTYVANDSKNDGESTVDSNDKEYLVLRNFDNGTDTRMRIIILKFDVTGFPYLMDGATNVKLGVTVQNDGFEGESVDVSIFGVTDEDMDNDEDFDYAASTYEGAPGLDDADLGEYELNDAEFLTKLTVQKSTTSWVYSDPSVEMDAFIEQSNDNNLLTFILLLEDLNGGDELRFYSEHGADTTLAPRLIGDEIVVSVESNSLANFSLEQNHPNPFNGTTTLSYNLNQTENVELTIYNMLGKNVATLVNEQQTAGAYNVDIDMDNLQLPAGIYYTKVTVGSESQTIKMINKN